AWREFRRNVHLKAHTVDRHAVTPQPLSERVDGIRFRTEPRRVVGVQEEPGIRVGLVRPSEGQVDVVGSDDIQPDRLAHGAVIGYGLVHDIPRRDAPLVSPDYRLNVSPQRIYQALARPVAVLQPAGKL